MTNIKKKRKKIKTLLKNQKIKLKVKGIKSKKLKV